MQSEHKTETIERMYWSCTVAEHRHHERQAAERCIERATKPRSPNAGRRWTPEEMMSVASRWAAGETLQALATEFKLSRERIRQVVYKGERIARHRANRAKEAASGKTD